MNKFPANARRFCRLALHFLKVTLQEAARFVKSAMLIIGMIELARHDISLMMGSWTLEAWGEIFVHASLIYALIGALVQQLLETCDNLRTCFRALRRLLLVLEVFLRYISRRIGKKVAGHDPAKPAYTHAKTP